ncbi:hypothetical protein EDD18DRAFT_1358353 [Armillaria luteobubalina]|uniref:Uncharacterized protein n=1 Tax=Armillaria luteobubalina TaxID=153913 RepID=A0AA39UPM4_9AGAR|nr:hypothetical protein EDD18DRAFT_1358353 [Armillaria luteobubalina]
MSSGQPVVVGQLHEPCSGVVCHHLQKLCLALVHLREMQDGTRAFLPSTQNTASLSVSCRLKRLGLILAEVRSTQDDVSNGARSTMGNPAHYHETIVYVVSQEYAIVTHLLVRDTQVRAIGGFQRLFAGSSSLIRLDLDLTTIHNLLSAADGGSCSTLTWRFVHGLPNTPLPVQKPRNGPLCELSIEYSSYTCCEVEFNKMISWLAGNVKLEMAKKVLGYGESFLCQVDARFIEKLRLHLNGVFEVSPAIWERWSTSVIDLTLGGSNAVALSVSQFKRLCRLSFELVYPINPHWAFDVMSTWEVLQRDSLTFIIYDSDPWGPCPSLSLTMRKTWWNNMALSLKKVWQAGDGPTTGTAMSSCGFQVIFIVPSMPLEQPEVSRTSLIRFANHLVER